MEKTVLKKKVVILELPGGPSKGDDGYRPDTVAGVQRIQEELDWVVEVVFYRERNHDRILKFILETSDAVVVHCSDEELRNPSMDPTVLSGLQSLLEELVNSRLAVFPFPSLGRDGKLTASSDVPLPHDIRDVVIQSAAGIDLSSEV